MAEQEDEQQQASINEEQASNEVQPMEVNVKDDDDEEDETEDEKEELGGKDIVPYKEGLKQSRSEKKSRKAILKLGMKPMAGVTRVTMKRNKDLLFVFSKPDVYKSPSSETYVIFGEAVYEELSCQRKSQAAQPFRKPEGSMLVKPTAQIYYSDDDVDYDEEEEIDETGVEESDIDLVMAQAGVSRGRAMEALKANSGDIVDAIMDLTA